MSSAPLLQGRAGVGRGPIFWHYPHYGNQGGTPGAVGAAGDWKLIEFFESGREELYNLASDIGETRNLAGERRPTSRGSARSCTRGGSGEARLPAPNPDWRG